MKAKQKIWAVVFCWTAMMAVQTQAITVGPFGSKGEGGTKNGQSLQVGAGGSVYELDAFLSVQGQDLNGSQVGTSAQLSQNSLPAGMIYSFSWTLSSNKADLVLTYTFSNTTSTVFTNLRFFPMLDAEIDERTNTFFNEYGATNGVPGLGIFDPDRWQIDEPGFQTGTLIRNLLQASLSNSNRVPQSALNDVALALGFPLGDLWPGDSVAVKVMISEATNSLGPFALVHRDSAAASPTVITFSGQAVPAELAGRIFADGNSNAVFEAGEGLTNVTMSLLANQVTPSRVTTTDANGRYSFGNPAPGNYSVRVEQATLPAGLTNTSVRPAGATAFQWNGVVAADQTTNLSWGYLKGVSQSQFANVTGSLRFGFRQWILDRGTGSLLGTIGITNPPASGFTYSPPYQLGLHPPTNIFYYPHPAGKLPDGIPYVDLSAAMSARVPGGTLNPGQSAVLTNAVEVYSLTRTPPTNTLFEIWATQSGGTPQ